MSSRRRCNMDGLPLSERDQAAVDAFARFLREQGGPARAELEQRPPERRPFCGAWPFPSSDMDLVTSEQNAATHRARDCCDGW